MTLIEYKQLLGRATKMIEAEKDRDPSPANQRLGDFISIGLQIFGEAFCDLKRIADAAEKRSGQ